MKSIFLATVVWSYCIGTASAVETISNDTLPTQTFKIRDSIVGTLLKRDVISSSIPFDKTYAQLTPEQKTIVRSEYDSLSEGDEPPFPASGLRRIVTPIYKLALNQKSYGDLVLLADVSPEWSR